MITFSLLCSYLCLSALGWGHLITRSLGWSEQTQAGTKGLLGVIGLTIFALTAHLFGPLRWMNWGVHLTGVVVCTIWIFKNRDNLRGTLLCLGAVVLVSLLGTLSGIHDFSAWRTNPDWAAPFVEYDVMLYHLQSILLFAWTPVSVGLANFAPVLAYNSSLHALGGSLAIAGFEKVGAFAVSPLLIGFFLTFCFEWAQTPARGYLSRVYFLVLGLLSCLLSGVVLSSYYFAYGHAGNPITDLGVWVLTLILVGLAIEVAQSGVKGVEVGELSLLLGLWLVACKVSSGLLFALVLFGFWRAKSFPSRRVLLLSFVFCLAWVVHGVLLSGGWLFPASFSRVGLLPWAADPQVFIGVTRAAISDASSFGGASWPHGFLEHVLASKPFRICAQFTLLGLVLIVPRFRNLPKGMGWIVLILIVNLIAWVLTVPRIRFAGGSFIALGVLMLSIGIAGFGVSRYWNAVVVWAPRIGVGILGARFLLGASTVSSDVLFHNFPRLPPARVLPLSHSDPRIELFTADNSDGRNDRCIDRFLCTPHHPRQLNVRRLSTGHFYFPTMKYPPKD